MSSVPLHPMVVHFPLVLAALLPFAAIVPLVLVLRKKDPVIASRLVAVGFVALTLSGFAATQTGEADEHVVEPVVGEVAFDTHEERAETFVWTATGATVAALLSALIARRRALWTPLAALTVAGSIGVMVLALGVGHSGGELVYVHGAAGAHISAAKQGGAPAAQPDPSREKADHDD